MKIVVTGANGQVGRHLSDALASSCWDVTLLNHEQLDISCEKQVRDVIYKHRPSILINTAAYTKVDDAEKNADLAYAVNSNGARYLASATGAIDAAILHISSDYVFSGSKPHEYAESDLTQPLNMYGASKRAGELAVIKANKRHIILRTSWVFSRYGNNFLYTMLRLAKEREKLTVISDQFGGPTYAGDLANAIVKILTQYDQASQLPWGIYHYSGYPYTSWFDFANAIFHHIALKNSGAQPVVTPISYADYPAFALRPTNSRLSCKKIKDTFNIDMSDWQRALKTHLDQLHHEDNPNNNS